jgi:hypothetical protein
MIQIAFYPADYSKIDPHIYSWAQKHKLHVLTFYKDSDVRSVEIVDNSVNRYQIWIDAPDEKNEVLIHAWDYKKKRIDVKSSLSNFADKLEGVYLTILSWGKDTK